MAVPNVSDLVATTIENRSGVLVDNVLNNNAIYKYLKEKGNVKPFSGGTKITQEFAFQENGNFGWYSGYDLLPVAAQDVISYAEFTIKQCACPVVISGLEELQNAGKESIIDLMEGRISTAESTMANNMSVAAYSDGTGYGGKQLGGLQILVPDDPTTGTCGGINRVNWSFWRSQVASVATKPAAGTIQVDMNGLWAKCVRGVDRPDLILADSTTWAAYMASLQTIQRFTDPKSADLGFGSVKYMTADFVLDGGIGGACPSQRAYFLNTKYLYLRPHKNRNMVPLTPQRRVAINQDAQVEIIAWAGNMTTSAAKLQGILRYTGS